MRSETRELTSASRQISAHAGAKIAVEAFASNYHGGLLKRKPAKIDLYAHFALKCFGR
jgi:hypothetical protein